jgi:hypothetical protein
MVPSLLDASFLWDTVFKLTLTRMPKSLVSLRQPIKLVLKAILPQVKTITPITLAFLLSATGLTNLVWIKCKIKTLNLGKARKGIQGKYQSWLRSPRRQVRMCRCKMGLMGNLILQLIYKATWALVQGWLLIHLINLVSTLLTLGCKGLRMTPSNWFITKTESFS